jgi:hypothetical protein
MDTTNLNTACLEEFGEWLTFTVSGVLHGVTGIVTRPTGPVSTRNAPQGAMLASVMGGEDLRIQLRTTDIADHGIGKGSTVAISNRTYRVTQAWPDDGGMTALECRT